jgi:crotonobetainyl-CoA:carnitine CoA-transferase CaiB-like acyl-CoA transferase
VPRRNGHLSDRDLFQQIDQPEIGPIPIAGAPFKMSETPLRAGPAPRLSEHTQDVLLDLGYSKEDTLILHERGIT